MLSVGGCRLGWLALYFLCISGVFSFRIFLISFLASYFFISGVFSLRIFLISFFASYFSYMLHLYFSGIFRGWAKAQSPPCKDVTTIALGRCVPCHCAEVETLPAIGFVSFPATARWFPLSLIHI